MKYQKLNNFTPPNRKYVPKIGDHVVLINCEALTILNNVEVGDKAYITKVHDSMLTVDFYTQPQRRITLILTRWIQPVE